MLEATERGKWGESSAPLQGKEAAVVMTGAAPEHFLALGAAAAVRASDALRALTPQV